MTGSGATGGVLKESKPGTQEGEAKGAAAASPSPPSSSDPDYWTGFKKYCPGKRVCL